MLAVLRFFWKHRRPLLKFNIPVAALALLVSLLLPKWYKSSLTFLIEEGETSSLLASVVGSLPLPLTPGIATPADKYIAILKSRRVLDQVIENFDLKTVYDNKYIEDTYKELLSNSSFTDNEDGTVTIECLYKGDPKKASEMTNFFFEKAEQASTELSQERAKKYREYMEAALKDSYRELSLSEDSLNAYQKRYDVIDLEEQTKAIVEQISLLEVQKLSLEMEKEYLESIHEVAYPQIRTLIKNIEVINGKIASLKDSANYTNIPFNAVPDIGLQYLRLYRDVEIRQKVIEFLVPQVEQAKIEEKRTATNLVVIDWAVPAERKVKPKRALLCIAITFLGIVASTAYLYSKERFGITREKIRELFTQSTNSII